MFNNNICFIGNYLAFKTKVYGWQRGIVKAMHDDYLTIYAVDLSIIEMVSKKGCLKKIPEDVASIPIQAVHLTLSTKTFDENDLLSEFKIKASNGAVVVDNTLEGILVAEDGTDFDKISMKSWLGDFQEYYTFFNTNDAVKITRVVSISDVYLTLVNEVVPVELFKPIAKNSKVVEKTCSDIVLFPVNDEFVRGKIMKETGSTVQCFDIDTGYEYDIALNDIRAANNFVKTIPVSLKKVQLAYLKSMKSPYENNKAFTVLERHMNENFVFYINYATDADGENAGVELLFKDKNCLNKQLLPLIFEKVEINSKISMTKEKNQPDIPQDVMKFDKDKSFDVSNIEVIPLTTGENITVTVIDTSTLTAGYFSAFDPKLSTDHLKMFTAKYDKLVSEYAARTDIGNEYCPEPNEVCIAVFDDDGIWYRSFCVEAYANGKFLLIFLDYGNYVTTDKTKIRKITKELMFPSNANNCIIKGK